MKKLLILSAVSLISSAVCWYIEIAVNPSGLEAVLFGAATVLSMLFFCSLVTAAVIPLNNKLSPYKVFAAVCILMGLLTAAFAIYELYQSQFDHVILGGLLLLFAEPGFIIFLIGDFICWLLHKKGRSQK